MDLPRAKQLQILDRPSALVLGDTDETLRRRIIRDELTRIRPGAYLDSSELRTAPTVVRHHLKIQAVAHALGVNQIFSHVSAAVLHGLPVWNVPLRQVHITKNRHSGGHVNGELHTHCSPLVEAEIVAVERFSATSVARTLVDLARTVTFESAVVVADFALFHGLVQPAELVIELERARRQRGAAAAHRALSFATPLSQSVGESRSRVLMHVNDVPTPSLQHEVFDASGRLLGIGDFAWEAENLIGEFDGYVKYERYLRPGETPGEAVFREKQREDAFRQTGKGVVRWVWAELGAPELLVRKWQQALAARR